MTPSDFASRILREMSAREGMVGLFQVLVGIGRTIADAIPSSIWIALASANAAVAPRPLDVLLLTAEPYVPWELAVLEKRFDMSAPPFLGAQTNIGRWPLEGRSTPIDPPRRVDVESIAVVWGLYESSTFARLVGAEAEAKQIQELYGATSIDARPDPVFRLLAGQPPAEIFHFAVHGQSDPQGAGDGIWLVDGPPVNALQIRGSDLSGRAPFVFLNVGSYGGIPQAFVQAGASAVISPLWAMDDDTARRSAIEFYRQALWPAGTTLSAGRAEPLTEETSADSGSQAVADILRRARHGLVQDAGAQFSTYLAYQFYGHPSLRLFWHGSGANGGRPVTEQTERSDVAAAAGMAAESGEMGDAEFIPGSPRSEA